MKRVSPYLKMRVLGAIEFAPGNTIKARIQHVSTMVHTDEDDQKYVFTWRTIQTWYSRYKKDGITSMHPRTRSDKGFLRKMRPEELEEAIEQVLPSFREVGYNVTDVYRACVVRHLLDPSQVALTTFRRAVKEYELLEPQTRSTNKRRLAFAKAHANELWQADTMFGPHVQNGPSKTQVKLIAFIDDASRVICHGEFFFSENTDTLIKALRSVLYKRGVPEAMYVDNGSIYTSKEIQQICTRPGCLLCHAPVRDGAAKGKIERFFRTVRMSFLTRALDLSSLDALNRAFTAWVEDEYNAREHSTIRMKPIDRFGLDLRRIRFLPPNEVSDELFYVEQERTVLADNTFSLKGSRYEAPRDLRSRKVQVRFDRKQHVPEGRHLRAVVFYKVSAWAKPSRSTSSATIASRAESPRPTEVTRDPGALWAGQEPLLPRGYEAPAAPAGDLRTLRVHCQQGGLCLIVGEPGTGKSLIKHALCQHDPKRLITPVVNRTLHSYASTLRILCEAFQIDTEGRDFRCEARLIQEAQRINHLGKMLAPIIDDAHLLSIDALRRIRLLLEDFPKNHNLILVAQLSLLNKLSLTSNEDIKSRVTYSVVIPKLAPDAITDFIHDQFDRVALAHSTLSPDALALIVRSSEGILRRARNLCLSSLLEAVRDRSRTVELKQVNRVLLQPHWREEQDIL